MSENLRKIWRPFYLPNANTKDIWVLIRCKNIRDDEVKIVVNIVRMSNTPIELFNSILIVWINFSESNLFNFVVSNCNELLL